MNVSMHELHIIMNPRQALLEEKKKKEVKNDKKNSPSSSVSRRLHR